MVCLAELSATADTIEAAIRTHGTSQSLVLSTGRKEAWVLGKDIRRPVVLAHPTLGVSLRAL